MAMQCYTQVAPITLCMAQGETLAELEAYLKSLNVLLTNELKKYDKAKAAHETAEKEYKAAEKEYYDFRLNPTKYPNAIPELIEKKLRDATTKVNIAASKFNESKNKVLYLYSSIDYTDQKIKKCKK